MDPVLVLGVPAGPVSGRVWLFLGPQPAGVRFLFPGNPGDGSGACTDTGGRSGHGGPLTLSETGL